MPLRCRLASVSYSGRCIVEKHASQDGVGKLPYEKIMMIRCKMWDIRTKMQYCIEKLQWEGTEEGGHQ